MEKNNYLIVSMEDPRLENISEILRNKTCKKIISYLSEKNSASENDIADDLKLPLTTVGYNVDKLLESGFIKKKKEFFWSKKGRKIKMYALSNKSILISPGRNNTEKLKSVIPAFLLTISTSALIYAYEKIFLVKEKISESSNQVFETALYAKDATASMMAERSPEVVTLIGQTTVPYSLWFLLGGIFVLFIFSIVNWRKL